MRLNRLLGLLLLVPLLLSGLLLLLLVAWPLVPLLLVVGLVRRLLVLLLLLGLVPLLLVQLLLVLLLVLQLRQVPCLLGGGAGGWAGGSPWGFFFFGVGGLDGDILMVFGSGQRSSMSSASYVSHHDCHLPNSSYALLLAENTWQLGMNSDQSSSSSSSSPCWLGLH